MTVERWEQPTLTHASRDIVDGWGRQLADVAKLAGLIAGSPFVPEGLRSDAAVAAAVLTGREIGIGPMTSLAHMHVIKGRTGMSAELMRALVLARGHRIRIVQYDSARVALVGQRAGEPESPEFAWTMDDARRARLLGNPAWGAYPRAMLLSRASAELCRAVFPDVIGGLVYSTEELQDMAFADDNGAAPPPDAPTRTVRRRNTPRPALASSSTDAASDGPGGGPHPAPPPTDPPPPQSVGGELPPLPEDAPTPPPAAQNATDTAEQPTPAPEHPDEGHKPLTPAQRGMVFDMLGEVGATLPRAKRLYVASGLVGRRLASVNQLTRREASALIDTLALVRDSLDPGALDALVASGWERIGGTEVDAPDVGAEFIDPNQMTIWDPDRNTEEGNDHDDGR